MKVLFICNANIDRSKTAEEIFKEVYETKSAGVFSENPVSAKEIEWADTIVVMENEQRRIISERFPKLYLKKRIISLNIPDIYSYNQPELIALLKEKMKKLLLN